MDETVISAIFSKEGKILLVKRRDVPVWVLPGGGKEKGESLEEACIREAFEETGFQVEIIRKIGEYRPLNRLARYTHLFECKPLSGEICLSDECKAVSFFDSQDLPKKIPPPHDEWIEDAFAHLPVCIYRDLTRVNYRNLLKNFFLHPILVIRFLLSKIGLTINT